MSQYTDFHAMNLGELETDVLRKLWINASEDSNGFPAAAAFAKYSKYRVDKKINQVYSDMVIMTNAISKWFILPLVANYTQYPVPQGIYDIKCVYYFSSAASYVELDVEDEGIIEDLLNPGWRSYPSIPMYAYVGDSIGMRVKLGIAPASKTSATAITIAAGGDTVARPYGSVDAVSGSASPDSAATAYVDSEGQNFDSLGIIVGLFIYNITTATMGAITSITTTNTSYDTINSAVTWTPGDEMRIFAGDSTGFIEITDQDASYILSPVLGAFPNPGITMAANNLLVHGYSQPVKLVDEWQYPELNPLFHAGIALGAAALLGKEEPPDSPEYAQAIAYENDFNKNVGSLSGFATSRFHQGAQIISRRK